MKKSKNLFNLQRINKTILFLVLGFFIFILAGVQFYHPKLSLNKSYNPQEKVKYYRVTGVDDGDTIVLEDGSTIRYLGIDTPETHHPTIGEECGGKEATDYNKKLVEGKRVRLIKDITDKDQYGRLLRYVFTEDGQFVNYMLIRNGFAQTLPISPDMLFDKTFEDALKIAKKENLGIWKKCFNQKGGEKNERTN
jgi:micrococcal nuclease